MHFIPFLFAVIFMAVIIAFPFLVKIFLKVEGCPALSSGICCNILCLVSFGVAFGLWAILSYSSMKKKYSNFSIPFTFTVSELWREGEVYSERNIHIYYFVLLLVLEPCIFLLLICFIKRAINKMTSNRQIFTFISGFNFTFVIVFFINLLNSFELIGDKDDRESIKFLGISYAGLIFCFELFSFSYLLHISGLILLLFLWLKNSARLMLFIGIGASIIPLIFFLIGVAAKSSFVSDILTPILFLGSLGPGIFFFIKNGDDNAGGDYVAQPQI